MNEIAFPPVSIIVCTRNRAALLPRMFDQLCAQNYPQEAFEIIIVDNCSTDGTPEVVQSFIRELDCPLRYVREDRSGVTFARNRGAKEARYTYLAYLDDDCSVGENWLVQLVSGFMLGEQVAVVAGRVDIAYDEQEIPPWLGPVSKRWLAEFNFPASQPILLDNPTYVCEGNMAISKEAWGSVDGFLGMDQFSSPHVASQEIVYLLEKIKRRGGKVAFVPEAIADHHTVIPTRKQLLTRAYFHGVSSGILNYLLKGFSLPAVIFRVVIDVIATFVFILLSFIFLFTFDKASSMDFLLRAAMRLGRALSELRLAGNWRRVRAWMLTQRSR